MTRILDKMKARYEQEIISMEDKINEVRIYYAKIMDEQTKKHTIEMLEARIGTLTSVLCDMQECPAKEFNNEKLFTLTQQRDKLKELRKK